MKPTAKPADNKKKLLVVVLLGVLLIVVLFQSFGSKKSSDSTANGEPTAALATTPTGPAAGPAALAALQERLPKVDLNQFLAHDPFQLLGASRLLGSSDAATDDQDPSGSGASSDGTEASQLATLQVSAILHGGARPAVMIGQRLYYEQDRLSSGWRILAIHPDRVSVERMDDAP